MYSTKKIEIINDAKLDRYTANDTKKSKKPTYIGLRVNLYTPEVTKDDVSSGLVGFTVVFDCLKEKTPAKEMATPINKITVVKMIFRL